MEPSKHDKHSPLVAPEAESEESAFFDLPAQVRLWAVSVVALGADLWSKSAIFDSLGPADKYEAIPGILSFRRSINPGALFGMGKGMVPVFIVASFVAIGFVLYLFACSPRKRKWLHMALSFVLAGSLGNLYDRVFMTADYVRFRDTGEHHLVKIVEDDGASPHILIGAPPDGANPAKYRRENVEVGARVGVVRDFLKFEPKIGAYDAWPWVFNVADSLLVVGVGLLLIHFWLDRRAEVAALKGDAVPPS